MDLQTKFWDADINELELGYVLGENKAYNCLVCGELFDSDEIFQVGDKFVTAKRMMEIHIQMEHGSMFEHLIGLHKNYTSLSDNQREVLVRMHKGYSDKEIAVDLGITESTIRNYRFKFKEKEKQAKAFLAIMGTLNVKEDNTKAIVSQMITPHKGATQLDERYNITEQDVKKAISAHMDENGGLKSFPSKEKKKIILLREIAKNFKAGKSYNEKEINRVLKRIYDDYALIRRYLIQYGFLDRKNDGSGYWVK